MASSETPVDIDDGRAYGRDHGPLGHRPRRGRCRARPAANCCVATGIRSRTSDEATTVPREVRLLGEDLILYRDASGTPGLLEPRCCHRGTSLYFGRVEETGIRCPYHGWLFDADGTCLDQPCEPDRGRNKDSYRQPWYPVVEYHGLLFTYMGPAERQPVFPRYDIFDDLADDEEIVTFDRFAFGGPDVAPCNWFQTHENAMDPYHVFILHNAISGPQFDPRLEIWPRIDWQRHPWGVTATQDRQLPDGTTLHRITEIRVPTMRVIPTPTLAYLGRTNNLSWAIPIDDTHTRVIAMIRKPKGEAAQGLALYDGDRSWFDLSDEEHQRFPGDYETQVGQGPITRHSTERLSSTDRGVSMVRRQFKEQVQIVADGGDPVGVAFDPDDAVVSVIAGNYIVGPDTDLASLPLAETLA